MARHRHVNSVLLLVVVVACSSSVLWSRPVTCTKQDLPRAFEGLGVGNNGPTLVGPDLAPGTGVVRGGVSSSDLEQAKVLAQALHNEIYADRVADLKQRIDTMDDESLENVKNKLKEALGVEDGVSDYTKKRLAEISDLSPDTMRKALWDKVNGLKVADTVGVMSSKEGNYLVIGANIMSPDIPDVHDTGLWSDVLRVKELKRGERLYEWKRKDFGLQEADNPAILRVLETQSSEDGVKWTDRDVYVVDKVKPPAEGEESAKWRKLQKESDALGKQIERDTTKLEELKSKEVEKLKKFELDKMKKLEKDISDNSDRLTRKRADIQRTNHAEMQLQQMRNTNPNRFGYADAIISPSKPSCENCENVLKDSKVAYPGPDGYEGMKQTKKKNIKNWAQHSDVGYTQIMGGGKDLTKSQAGQQDDTKSAQPALPAVCSTGGNTRRRRSTSARRCAFWTTESPDDKTMTGTKKRKKAPHVDEIDAAEFVKEYAGASEPTRKLMTDTAADNPGKVTGEIEDVQKVGALVDYEKMQKHVATVEQGGYVLKSGNFFDMDKPVKGKYTPTELNGDGKSRLSPKAAARLAKINQGANTVNKVGGYVGHALLAKHAVQAIHNGDTTSLAIMGGRLGGEFVLKGIGKGGKILGTKSARAGSKAAAAGAKASKAAKIGAKASKGMKFVGKVAGPLGIAADIGLGSWAIASAAERLRDPSATKAEQNDAIADIVESSVDIVVTVAVTVASIAFPIGAPVFMAIGIVVSLVTSIATLIFKLFNAEAMRRDAARRHVEMLESQILLLEHERSREFDRHMAGKGTMYYIEDLINVKRANNLMAAGLVKFLEENPDLVAVVVPSRTFSITGHCRLEVQHCKAKVGKSDCLAGQWEGRRVEAWDCLGHGGKCGGSNSHFTICESQRKVHVPASKNGFDRHYCECEGNGPKEELLEPHKDSLVDFRSTQTIWVDRGAQDDLSNPGYANLCKPSSTIDMGERVSNRHNERGFLCYHAMGVKRKNNGQAKYVQFDLGGGTDTAYADSHATNLFSVGDGRKHFEGGAGADVFSIQGPCSELTGELNGWGSRPDKGEFNLLTIGGKCVPSRRLTVDLTAPGWMTDGTDGGVYLQLRQMQVINGRRALGDEIRVGCDTRQVDGLGGRGAYDPDLILVGPTNCTYRVLLMPKSYTTLRLDFMQGDVDVLVPMDLLPTPGLLFEHKNAEGLEHTRYKVDTECWNFVNATYLPKRPDSVGRGLTIQFSTGGQIQDVKFEMRGEGSTSIPNVAVGKKFGDGAWRGCSLALDHNEERVVAVTRLEEHNLTPLTRYQGAPGVSNVFLCADGVWTVIGGNQDDDFILLNSTHFGGKIDGGPRGLNSIRLDSRIPDDTVRLDFANGVMSINLLRVVGVQQVFGRPNKTEVITADCSARFIAGGGGLAESAPDKVLLVHQPAMDYSTKKNATQEQEALVVVGTGHTLISSRLLSCPQVFVIPTQPGATAEIQLDNTTRTPSAAEIQVILQFPISSLAACALYAEENNDSFVLRLKGAGVQIVRIVVRTDSRSSGRYYPDPAIQFEELIGARTQLLLGKDGGMLAFHSLDSSGGATRKSHHRSCSPLVPNYVAWSPDASWGVDCKNDQKNTFEIKNPTRVYGNGSEFKMLTVTFNARADTDIAIHSDMGQLQAFEGDVRRSEYKIQLEMVSRRTVALVFDAARVLEDDEGDAYLTAPQIVFVTDTGNGTRDAGTLLIRKEDGAGLGLHELGATLEAADTPTSRIGARRLPNLFRLISGNWDATGGLMSDTFILLSDNFRGSITGVDDTSPNTLIVGAGFTGGLHVDLSRNWIHVGAGSSEAQIKVKHVHVVGGRPGVAEKVTTDCSTTYVDGGGGASALEPDVVHIPADGVRCGARDARTRLTLMVATHTQVKNEAEPGTGAEFVYVVLQDDNFDISLAPSTATAARHSYQFRLPLESILSLEFNLETSTLQLRLTSGKLVDFLLSDGDSSGSGEDQAPTTTFRNPVIQFEPPQTQGNVRADIRVDSGTGRVSSFIKVEGTQSLVSNVTGIRGIRNNFDIDDPGAVFDSLQGSTHDDNFRLASVGSILALDGGAFGEGGNTLTLTDDLHPGMTLIVNMEAKAGALIASTKPDPRLVIGAMRGLQVLQGREEGYDIVIPACGTRSITNVEDIWFEDMNCSAPGSNYNVSIHVGPQTAVLFDHDPISSNLTAAYAPGAVFVYKLDLLRSFSIETDFWFRLRGTRHVFHLAFDLHQLDTISFNPTSSELVYSIGNETYAHSVDPYVEPDQQYHALPQFLTTDGVQIQIARDGGIFLSTAAQGEDDFMEELVPGYILLVKRLQVTLMVQTPSDFIYVDYSVAHQLNATETDDGEGDEEEGDLDDACIPNPNLLTNVEGRVSHLAGGGDNTCGESEASTMYSILSLDHDVFIYPIFETEADLEEPPAQPKQLIDLTNIVMQIRNLTGSKYVPTVEEIHREGASGGVHRADLIVRMKGFEDQYLGRVVIVDGVRITFHLRVLLNSVVMLLTLDDEPSTTETSESTEPSSGSNGTRQRREAAEVMGSWIRRVWSLKPVPLRIPPGHVYILMADDLEYGQQIQLLRGNDTDTANGMNVGDDEKDASNLTTAFQVIQRDTDLLLTNLEHQLSTTPGDLDSGDTNNDISSLVFIDFYSGSLSKHSEPGEKTDPLQDVLIQVDGRQLQLIFSDPSTPEAEPVMDWEDLLEETEERVLGSVPEVDRKFRVPFWNRAWKTYRAWTVGALLGLALVGILAAAWAMRRICFRFTAKLEVNNSDNDNANRAIRSRRSGRRTGGVRMSAIVPEEVELKLLGSGLRDTSKAALLVAYTEKS